MKKVFVILIALLAVCVLFVSFGPKAKVSAQDSYVFNDALSNNRVKDNHTLELEVKDGQPSSTRALYSETVDLTNPVEMRLTIEDLCIDGGFRVTLLSSSGDYPMENWGDGFGIYFWDETAWGHNDSTWLRSDFMRYNKAGLKGQEAKRVFEGDTSYIGKEMYIKVWSFDSDNYAIQIDVGEDTAVIGTVAKANLGNFDPTNCVLMITPEIDSSRPHSYERNVKLALNLPAVFTDALGYGRIRDARKLELEIKDGTPSSTRAFLQGHININNPFECKVSIENLCKDGGFRISFLSSTGDYPMEGYGDGFGIYFWDETAWGHTEGTWLRSDFMRYSKAGLKGQEAKRVFEGDTSYIGKEMYIKVWNFDTDNYAIQIDVDGITKAIGTVAKADLGMFDPTNCVLMVTPEIDISRPHSHESNVVLRLSDINGVYQATSHNVAPSMIANHENNHQENGDDWYRTMVRADGVVAQGSGWLLKSNTLGNFFDVVTLGGKKLKDIPNFALCLNADDYLTFYYKMDGINALSGNIIDFVIPKGTTVVVNGQEFVFTNGYTMHFSKIGYNIKGIYSWINFDVDKEGGYQGVWFEDYEYLGANNADADTSNVGARSIPGAWNNVKLNGFTGRETIINFYQNSPLGSSALSSQISYNCNLVYSADTFLTLNGVPLASIPATTVSYVHANGYFYFCVPEKYLVADPDNGYVFPTIEIKKGLKFFDYYLPEVKLALINGQWVLYENKTSVVKGAWNQTYIDGGRLVGCITYADESVAPTQDTRANVVFTNLQTGETKEHQAIFFVKINDALGYYLLVDNYPDLLDKKLGTYKVTIPAGTVTNHGLLIENEFTLYFSVTMLADGRLMAWQMPVAPLAAELVEAAPKYTVSDLGPNSPYSVGLAESGNGLAQLGATIDEDIGSIRFTMKYKWSNVGASDVNTDFINLRSGNGQWAGIRFGLTPTMAQMYSPSGFIYDSYVGANNIRHTIAYNYLQPDTEYLLEFAAIDVYDGNNYVNTYVEYKVNGDIVYYAYMTKLPDEYQVEGAHGLGSCIGLYMAPNTLEATFTDTFYPVFVDGVRQVVEVGNKAIEPTLEKPTENATLAWFREDGTAFSFDEVITKKENIYHLWLVDGVVSSVSYEAGLNRYLIKLGNDFGTTLSEVGSQAGFMTFDETAVNVEIYLNHPTWGFNNYFHFYTSGFDVDRYDVYKVTIPAGKELNKGSQIVLAKDLVFWVWNGEFFETQPEIVLIDLGSEDKTMQYEQNIAEGNTYYRYQITLPYDLSNVSGTPTTNHKNVSYMVHSNDSLVEVMLDVNGWYHTGITLFVRFNHKIDYKEVNTITTDADEYMLIDGKLYGFVAGSYDLTNLGTTTVEGAYSKAQVDDNVNGGRYLIYLDDYYGYANGYDTPYKIGLTDNGSQYLEKNIMVVGGKIAVELLYSEVGKDTYHTIRFIASDKQNPTNGFTFKNDVTIYIYKDRISTDSKIINVTVEGQVFKYAYNEAVTEPTIVPEKGYTFIKWTKDGEDFTFDGFKATEDAEIVGVYEVQVLVDEKAAAEEEGPLHIEVEKIKGYDVSKYGIYKFERDGKMVSAYYFTADGGCEKNPEVRFIVDGVQTVTKPYTLVKTSVSGFSFWYRLTNSSPANVADKDTPYIVQIIGSDGTYPILDWEPIVDGAWHQYVYEGRSDIFSGIIVKMGDIKGELLVASVDVTFIYTATFKADGEVVATKEFTSKNCEFEGVAVPDKEGYTGKWVESKDGNNLVYTAEYTPIAYYARFVVAGTTYEDITFQDEIIANIRYTVETKDSVVAPAVPAKVGYTATWTEYTLGAADVVIKAVYTPVEYTATFKANNEVVKAVKFTVESTSIEEPAIPAKVGYTAAWESYTLGAEDVVVNAVYTPVVYKASFYAQDITYGGIQFNSLIAQYQFTVETKDSVVAPAVPAKVGYTAAWESYTLGAADAVVNAVYTPVEYTATFKANNEAVKAVKFTVESESIEAPAVPARSGYTAAWESYALGASDITVNAIYTPITYKATFKCDDVVVKVAMFDVTTEAIANPELIAKVGYTAAWPTVTLAAEDIVVNAIYTPIEYTVTFVADGETVATAKYTIESKDIQVPAVPAKEGFVGSWGSYKLSAKDITVYAVYVSEAYGTDTPVTPAGCGSAVGTMSLLGLLGIAIILKKKRASK